MPQLLDHVDLRVRNKADATAFYDAFLTRLGATKSEGDSFTTWRIPPPGGAIDDAPDNFGISEDRSHTPNAVRIAFKAPTRDVVETIALMLPALGARNVEGDDGLYGPDYCGVFFDDLDGNRLEICVNG